MDYNLENIPRALDHFITGIIGSVYRVVWGLGLVLINPFRGALRLYAYEKTLSSKAMLLLSAALGASSLWLGASALKFDGGLSNLLALIVRLSVLYILFDTSGRILARLAARRGRRRKRASALMRYAFASALIIASLAAPVREFLEQANLSWWAEESGQRFIKLGSLLYLVLLVLSFLQPAIVFLTLMLTRTRITLLPRLAGLAVGNIVLVGTYYGIDALRMSIDNIERVARRSEMVHIVETSCSLGSSGLSIAFAVENAERDPIYITPSSFKVHITTTPKGSSELSDQIDPDVFYLKPLTIMSGIDSLPPGGSAVIRAFVQPSNFIRATASAAINDAWCRIEEEHFVPPFDSRWSPLIINLDGQQQ